MAMGSVKKEMRGDSLRVPQRADSCKDRMNPQISDHSVGDPSWGAAETGEVAGAIP